MLNEETKLSADELIELKSFCKEVRKDILKMVHCAKSGHPGGSLSSVEILSVLYKKVLKVPSLWDKSPEFKDRDRFILSKGHASPVFYSVLARCGFFPVEELMTFRKLGTRLQGHPGYGFLPGVEVSTGSLGQGLSIGCGVALGLKLDKSDANVFALMGDGELQEGSVWEAFMNAAHNHLNNLIVIIDRNRLQIDGNTESVKSLDPLDEKLEAFKWNVMNIDGHDLDAIYEAVSLAKTMDAPTAIIANTIKGKGVSFMENNVGWHGKAPNDEELQKALSELN